MAQTCPERALDSTTAPVERAAPASPLQAWRACGCCGPGVVGMPGRPAAAWGVETGSSTVPAGQWYHSLASCWWLPNASRLVCRGASVLSWDACAPAGTSVNRRGSMVWPNACGSWQTAYCSRRAALRQSPGDAAAACCPEAAKKAQAGLSKQPHCWRSPATMSTSRGTPPAATRARPLCCAAALVSSAVCRWLGATSALSRPSRAERRRRCTVWSSSSTRCWHPSNGPAQQASHGHLVLSQGSGAVSGAGWLLTVRRVKPQHGPAGAGQGSGRYLAPTPTAQQRTQLSRGVAVPAEAPMWPAWAAYRAAMALTHRMRSATALSSRRAGVLPSSCGSGTARTSASARRRKWLYSAWNSSRVAGTLCTTSCAPVRLSARLRAALQSASEWAAACTVCLDLGSGRDTAQARLEPGADASPGGGPLSSLTRPRQAEQCRQGCGSHSPPKLPPPLVLPWKDACAHLVGAVHEELDVDAAHAQLPAQGGVVHRKLLVVPGRGRPSAVCHLLLPPPQQRLLRLHSARAA